MMRFKVWDFGLNRVGLGIKGLGFRGLGFEGCRFEVRLKRLKVSWRSGSLFSSFAKVVLN